MGNELNPTTILIVLGALFLVGLAADLLGRVATLPRVTILLASGLLVGRSGFGLVPEAFLDVWFPALTSIALALIGFLLGQQLSIRQLRKRGRQVIGISLFKVTGAAVAVALALIAAGMNPVVALLLAAIAPATEPAATYEVVRESGAKGEFPTTLLSIVAIDDVWGLLIFVVLAAAASLLAGDAANAGVVAGSLVELGGSVVLGVGLGIPMAYLTGRIRHGEPTLVEAMGFVLLAAGLAEWLGLLPVLAAMVMGGVVASLATHHERPFHAIEGVEWPFMVLFFVFAGAAFRVESFRSVAALTAGYIAARCFGIYFAARLGCRVFGAGPGLRKWLGLALFPQAGIAIGMALIASQRFPDLAGAILPVVLASSIFLELTAPVLTRVALRRAGAV